MTINNNMFVLFQDAFMVTFFNPIDAIMWCIHVQKELLKIEWPAELFTQPAASLQFAKDDSVK